MSEAVARLVYALRFHRPPNEKPTLAPGLSLVTRLEGGRLRSELEPLPGEQATLELEYRLNHDGTLFFEWGSVRFGDGGLDFEGIGAGTLLAPPDPDGFSHGTIAYRVTAGHGPLTGAEGVISSNFLVDLDTEELIDTHLGVIRLP